MPAPDPEVTNLAETILRLTRNEGPTLWAVGKLRMPAQTGSLTSYMAYVSGILDVELPINRSAWCSPFITQFASTTSLNGRRALVLFVNAQPLLLCTIGD